MADINAIAEQIQGLTLLEASQLVKLLEENRRLINESLQESGRGKASFTHLIGWAIVQAAKKYPALNNGFGVVDGAPSKIQNPHINLGLAIDVEKKDGTRNLLVPNIKNCESMNFAEFFAAYNEQVKKARDGKLEIADFQGTTISLTNPGTIGTVASNPRLMSGQSAITYKTTLSEQHASSKEEKSCILSLEHGSTAHVRVEARWNQAVDQHSPLA